MCIRDRIKADKGQKVNRCFKDKELVAVSLIAVSYTHLDVYKRQGSMGRTVTSMGSGAASMDFATRSFTASSMLIPWLSASSVMGVSNSSR